MHARLPIVLGTAQIGMPYGIANSGGLMAESDSFGFLQRAWELGYRSLDTAQGYGESEGRIGNFLKEKLDCQFDVVTKISTAIDMGSAKTIEESVRVSAARLGAPLFGVLLHSGKMLESWDGPLGTTLQRLQTDGLIQNLGVSIYTQEEFEAALKIPVLRLIQVPFHIFDQEFLSSGCFAEAQAMGHRIYVRSVFLQGLLVMDPLIASIRVPGAESYLARWWDIVKQSGRSATSVAFHFVRACLPNAELILGCETQEQLLANARTSQEPGLHPEAVAQLKEFGAVPEAIKSPRFWPKY